MWRVTSIVATIVLATASAACGSGAPPQPQAAEAVAEKVGGEDRAGTPSRPESTRTAELRPAVTPLPTAPTQTPATRELAVGTFGVPVGVTDGVLVTGQYPPNQLAAALDLETGAEVWRLSVPDPRADVGLRAQSVQQIVDGTLYSFFSPGFVFATAASSGEAEWQTDLREALGDPLVEISQARLAVFDSVLVVAARVAGGNYGPAADYVLVLDRVDGSLQSSATVTTEGRVRDVNAHARGLTIKYGGVDDYSGSGYSFTMLVDLTDLDQPTVEPIMRTGAYEDEEAAGEWLVNLASGGFRITSVVDPSVEIVTNQNDAFRLRYGVASHTTETGDSWLVDEERAVSWDRNAVRVWDVSGSTGSLLEWWEFESAGVLRLADGYLLHVPARSDEAGLLAVLNRDGGMFWKSPTHANRVYLTPDGWITTTDSSDGRQQISVSTW